MTKNTPELRAAIASDQPRLEELAVKSGLFPPEDMEGFSMMMTAHFSGESEGDFWIVAEEAGQITAAGYCGMEGFADRVANLYFIAVDPSLKGGGHGSLILSAVEQKLQAEDCRILIIETSGLDSFDLTRRFYLKHGYDEEARIRGFYGPGDDKVVYWKSL